MTAPCKRRHRVNCKMAWGLKDILPRYSCTPVAVPPEANREAWRESARWAANLSQIAHRLNMGEIVEIEDIRAELSRFRRSLLGEDEKS